MALSHQHEMHRRRLGRNVGLGAVLFAFVAIVFALSMVKVTYRPPVEESHHSAVQTPVSAAPASGAPAVGSSGQ